ncbi:PDZ domain-containing protein 11-like [Ruditapes philippinarum]|uniref:PDZ domain-containing protein 11-like n=1 Tax=Ruditapes philippinarum TaxID=129788 RepID=UPI00295A7679|nr:PDZ domain-containing protein 11-like [Ruditapes philippinarum]
MNTETRDFLPPYLPPYEHPPAWIPPHERDHHPDYCSDLERFLPRNISLQRSKTSEQLGFNIRGGKEHNCGIYISKVMSNSEADRLGLQEGDQILSVNEQNFELIEHSEAVKILKMNTSIWMVVRYFPYGYNQTYYKGRSSSGAPDSPTAYR